MAAGVVRPAGERRGFQIAGSGMASTGDTIAATGGNSVRWDTVARTRCFTFPHSAQRAAMRLINSLVSPSAWRSLRTTGRGGNY